MIWRKQRGFGTFDTNSRLFMTVAVVVGLCAVLASRASARVCNFDDLPVVPSGQLDIIPEGYCGTIWFGEGGPSVPYFSKSFSDQFGTYVAHSQPNATFTETGQFAFNPQSPEVFNGFWATLNPKAWQAPCYIHPSPGFCHLQIQMYLGRSGHNVYISPWIGVPASGGFAHQDTTIR